MRYITFLIPLLFLAGCVQTGYNPSYIILEREGDLSKASLEKSSYEEDKPSTLKEET